MMSMLKNSLLVLCSLLVTLLVVESLLRFTDVGDYSLNRRALFYTMPSFVTTEDKIVKYAANSNIRSVAIYGEHIDYDVTNGTNNMGLYDNIPYEKSADTVTDVAFLGDSFTAGSGSNTPWVSQLRSEIDLPNTNIYNVGVGGTGLMHFYHLLRDFNQSVPVDEVNIMVISNDFFRGRWYSIAGEQGLRFCMEKMKKSDCQEMFEPIIYKLDHQDSKEDILARAQQIYQLKKINEDRDKTFYQQIRLLNIVCDFVSSHTDLKNRLVTTCPHLKIFRALTYEKNDLYHQSIDAIGQMTTQFPQIKFRLFHFPEKEEVYAGHYALELKEDIEHLGLQYIPLLESCHWDMSMFHKHDPHPNNQGYGHLAQCVKKTWLEAR